MSQISIFDEIIVDNFAGGGGASTGIELAAGRPVAIAINHDPDAILLHKTNHPYTEHIQASVWDVDPVAVCRGRPVGLAWFSPDCKHFSKAKGAAERLIPWSSWGMRLRCMRGDSDPLRGMAIPQSLRGTSISQGSLGTTPQSLRDSSPYTGEPGCGGGIYRQEVTMGKHAIGGMRSMIVPNRKADMRYRVKAYLRRKERSEGRNKERIGACDKSGSNSDT